ncbi:hypothetical protein [Chloracidobacterium aggregatum]|uniref:hypothetical protein n=1 Tax=Chloracidobacterium aggregatum TaxID=2851959 RepID=UPI00387EA4B7
MCSRSRSMVVVGGVNTTMDTGGSSRVGSAAAGGLGRGRPAAGPGWVGTIWATATETAPEAGQHSSQQTETHRTARRSTVAGTEDSIGSDFRLGEPGEGGAHRIFASHAQDDDRL